ncbi:DUF6957 family protein [Pseudomonas savastanoi]|uniref:DUF6957 family protein n=1 Tax=Pseudomonas savastanoi TaxID=29438 RepID=UPI00399ACF1C
MEFLHGGGEPEEGLEGDLHRAEAYAILHYNRRPYCLVKDWIIAEVMVSEDFSSSLVNEGLAPCVLYASDVVLHSAGKRNPGGWVRSTFQQPGTASHVFQTRNTTYVLMGPGKRKRVSMETLMAIESQPLVAMRVINPDRLQY